MLRGPAGIREGSDVDMEEGTEEEAGAWFPVPHASKNVDATCQGVLEEMGRGAQYITWD